MRSLNTTYDGVFASGCLYHLTKAEFTVCLRDIHFLLNRNGVLYLNLKEGKGRDSETNLGLIYLGGKRAIAALKG
jgi:hypothetical protein